MRPFCRAGRLATRSNPRSSSRHTGSASASRPSQLVETLLLRQRPPSIAAQSSEHRARDRERRGRGVLVSSRCAHVFYPAQVRVSWGREQAHCRRGGVQRSNAAINASIAGVARKRCGS